MSYHNPGKIEPGDRAIFICGSRTGESVEVARVSTNGEYCGVIYHSRAGVHDWYTYRLRKLGNLDPKDYLFIYGYPSDPHQRVF